MGQHGDAEELADILTKLFASDHKGSRSVGGVAPGLRRTSLTSNKGKSDKDKKGKTSPKRAVTANIELSSQVSIVADSVNNSLLIRSNPRNYKKIVDALKQLDLVPL